MLNNVFPAVTGDSLCPACGAARPAAGGEMLWPPERACANCGHEIPQDRGFALLAPELADQVTGMDPASFAALRLAEDSHFWFRTRTKLLTGLIAQYFPQARSYLEIGCGNGVVLAAVARMRTWERLAGTELHPTALLHARERLGQETELVQLDARRIPARGVFDLAGAFDVIEHIPEDEAVLSALLAALKPGGGLIVSVPQHPFLWSAADDVAHHVRRYRRGEMEGKMRKAGFEILRSTSFTSLLLPAMAASRLLSGKPKGEAKSSADAEFAIPGWLNAAMGAVTGAEVALTLAGLSWPAGGSRVVLARRPA